MSLQFYIERAEFLERLIESNSDNSELIQAYLKLIEKVAEVNIQYFKSKESVCNEGNRQNSEVFRIKSDLRKTEIEKQEFPVGWSND
ncbi:hypothetical protein [Salinivibrio sp. ML290]|uniref:hypothetical protein n=1 Tax=Salinivibrio sp. ML290 TaxID=1909468 RepID=UPI0009889218|nr:hypothetical protein [Salinivibrio sp. ML290]OOE76339.1 hypothetical protein BZG23_02515 [Salinivibrio sp. ML290]